MVAAEDMGARGKMIRTIFAYFFMGAGCWPSDPSLNSETTNKSCWFCFWDSHDGKNGKDGKNGNSPQDGQSGDPGFFGNGGNGGNGGNAE